MGIEIHDEEIVARLQKQLDATGSASVDEVLLHLLETQEQQDHWLMENRRAINSQIKEGLDQLERGEGLHDDQLQSHLNRLKKRK